MLQPAVDARIERSVEQVVSRLKRPPAPSRHEQDAEQHGVVALQQRRRTSAGRCRARRTRSRSAPRRRASWPACRPSEGDHRQQRVAQHVPRTMPRRHALGAGRLDEVHRRHLEHRGAHQPQVDRVKKRPSVSAGSTMCWAMSQRARATRCSSAPMVFDAEGQQPDEPDREHQHGHQRHPEQRRRVEQQATAWMISAVGPAGRPAAASAPMRPPSTSEKDEGNADTISSSVSGSRSSISSSTGCCWR
jgi:hypothetical protein